MIKKREKLIKLRKDNELLQKDIAELLEISPQFYSSIERGERNPTLGLANKISDLFGLTIDELFFANRRRNMSRDKSTNQPTEIAESAWKEGDWCSLSIIMQILKQLVG